MVNRTLLHSLEPSETEWQKELDRAFSGMEASELDEIIAGFGEEEDSTLLGAYTLESMGFSRDPVRRQLVPLPMTLAQNSLVI